jgi:phage terminase small subunit
MVHSSLETLRDEGLLAVDERKLTRKNPAFSILMIAIKEFKAYLLEFGMTPSSRARIDIRDLKGSEDEWDEFFGLN